LIGNKITKIYLGSIDPWEEQGKITAIDMPRCAQISLRGAGLLVGLSLDLNMGPQAPIYFYFFVFRLCGVPA